MTARNTWFVIVSTLMLLCATGNLSAAQEARTQVDPRTVLKAIVDNPDFDVASLWRSLGIPAQLDTVYQKIGISPLNSTATFNNCSGNCVAEITQANLDADSSEEVILKV